jgi:hypothetical protein
MATEFTEENFEILFDEQQKVVEIRYQGVNAAALATLEGRVNTLETELDAAVTSTNGSIGTVAQDLSSLTALVNAMGNDVSAETLARLNGDETNSNNIAAANQAIADGLVAEAQARSAALIAEAEARGIAIQNATGGIVTDVAALVTTVNGIAASVDGNTASILSLDQALATETQTRATQYDALLVDFGNTNAAILSESTVRASETEALAIQIDALVATTGTNVFAQPDEPTVGMTAGDVWYDTDDGNKPYRYTGTAWVDVSDIRIVNNAAAIVAEQQARVNEDTAIASSVTTLSAKTDLKTRTFRQTSAPTSPTDGIPLVIGDVWFSTSDNNRAYWWDGTQWVDTQDPRIASALTTASTALANAATAQATADGVVEIFYQPTAPTGAEGDLWFDTDDGNKPYRHNGSGWVVNQDQKAIDAFTNAGLAQATADGKITAFYQTTAPTSASDGDLWYDTDDGNHPYRRSGTSWLSIRDATIAAASALAGDALDAANTAQATADGVVEIFYQASAPVGAEGDLWFDTDDGNKPYRHNGTGWVLNQDQKAIDAFTNAGLAQATADGKIRSFYQNGAPTGMTAGDVGDLWFDTDDNRKLYYWSGSAWVAATDVRVDNMGATIDAAVDVETQARTTAIGTVEAKYGVKVTAGGHVAGFGLIANGNAFNGTVDSEFVVDATRFKVYNGVSGGIAPFYVEGGIVYMQQAQIKDLTVGKLTSGTLGANITQNGDWSLGTGRIIFNNGTYMKVQGLGFGTTNQFIEWFGPTMAITSCNESNAIQYLKTNGDAYFGGSLSAGILRNATSTSTIGSGAVALLGPFGTNGGSKTVIWSFSLDHHQSWTVTTGNFTPDYTQSVTYLLERRISGGSWVTVGGPVTITATVTYTACPVNGEPGFYDVHASGSHTFTDTNTSTGDFEYQMRITSWALVVRAGYSVSTTQRMSIVSTEE